MRLAVTILACSLLMASCGQADEESTIETTPQAAAPTELDSAAQGPAQAQTFAIDSVPVSTASLGDFPYIGLPDGYGWMRRTETRDFDQFFFWTGSGLHEAEGKLYMGKIVAEGSKSYSAHEVKRNLDALIAGIGGVKIADSRMPRAVTDSFPEGFGVDKNRGLGDVYNHPVMTWVIRRPDREIWVHFTTTNAGGTMTVLETEPFVATASLLPASALKAAIETSGKAVVHVNFATDASDILPASRPQVSAIETLLREEPTLRLAINGHTDDTGTAERNRALSESRAASVRTALVTAGIAADRLTARGFGSSAPVASNGTEEGKALNRRVELVRQ